MYFKFFFYFIRRPQRCIYSISLNIGELQHTRILRNLCCLTGTKSGFERLDLNFPSLLKKSLSLKNIEHALCEFDKYFRFIITKSEKGREYSEKKSRSYLDKKPFCEYCSNEVSKAPIISLCLGICSKEKIIMILSNRKCYFSNIWKSSFQISIEILLKVPHHIFLTIQTNYCLEIVVLGFSNYLRQNQIPTYIL